MEFASSLPKIEVRKLLRSGRVADTFHVHISGRDYCLKVFRPDLIGDKNSVLQFKNEYRALAVLYHGSFFKPFDWGELDGVSYYFTEFDPHQSLHQLLAAGQLGISEREEIFIAIVEACAHLHEQGMVHFGIKPSNVLWDGNTCRLIQLGQVRFEDAEIEYPAVMVTDGITDPKIVSGQTQISKKSDVYSIFAVGKLLIEGKDNSHKFFRLFQSMEAGIVEDAVQALNVLKATKAGMVIDDVDKGAIVRKKKRMATIVASFLIIVVTVYGGFLFFNGYDVNGNPSVGDNTEASGGTFELPNIQLVDFPPPRKNLNAAQEQFWQFVNQYLIEALAEKRTQTIMEQGEIANYKYLPKKKNIPIKKSLVVAHVPNFLMRYSWVGDLMKRYSIVELNVDNEVEGARRKLEDHFYYKIKDLIRANNVANKEGRESSQNRKSYVKVYLEAMLLFDYLYSQGDYKCREKAMGLLYRILAPMRFDVYFSTFYGEMEQKGIEEIMLPAMLEFPEKFDDNHKSLVSSMYYSMRVHDKRKSPAYFNFLMWTLRDARLKCFQGDHERLTYATIQNMLADVEEWKYAFYWLHVNLESGLSSDDKGIAIYALKKIHGSEAGKVIQRYNKLLNLAYPIK